MGSRLRLLWIQNGTSKRQLGYRLVAIVFLVTFLSNLPASYIPQWGDLYRAGIAAAIAALLLLEKEETETAQPLSGGQKK